MIHHGIHINHSFIHFESQSRSDALKSNNVREGLLIYWGTIMALLLRVRSSEGMLRLELAKDDTVKMIREKVC